MVYTIEQFKYNFSPFIFQRCLNANSGNPQGKNCFGTVAYLHGLTKEDVSMHFSDFEQLVQKECFRKPICGLGDIVLYHANYEIIHSSIVVAIEPNNIQFSRKGHNKSCGIDTELDIRKAYFSCSLFSSFEKNKDSFLPHTVSYYLPKTFLK